MATPTEKEIQSDVRRAQRQVRSVQRSVRRKACEHGYWEGAECIQCERDAWRGIAVMLANAWSFHIKEAKAMGDIGFIREQVLVSQARALSKKYPPRDSVREMETTK